jgi:dipeptidyl aminopeptidase/acylaminoacyl peptidase
MLIALALVSLVWSGLSRTLPELSSVSSVVSGFSQTVSAQTRRPLEPSDIFALKTVSDPRISPDGAWVAYTVSSLDRKEDNSDTDVYMMATAGGAPIRLTSSKKPETSPRWSPDGRYLAFLSARDSKKMQVYVLDRRGGDAQAITDYKTGASSIAWSPDSSKLALLVPDPDPNDPPDTSTAQGRPLRPARRATTRSRNRTSSRGCSSCAMATAI